MPEARVIQQITNGGEIGPDFHGRTDTIKYQTSLARARNLFLHPSGASSNRSGLEFLAFSNDETYPTVFMEFEAANGDSYMLEFSHLEMRIFREGGIVLYPSGHALAGQIVVIVTPFSADRATLMDYDEANDVVTITTGLDNVYELSRLDHHIWTFAVQSFASPTNVPTSVAVAATTGYSNAAATDQYETTFSYGVTAILDDGRETVISAIVTVTNRLGWPQNFNTITWAAPAAPGIVVEKYAVYRRRNSLFGLVGFTTGLTFKDDNILPDWSYGPPTSKNPFSGDNKKPLTIAYFQQRRIFGGTSDNPFTLWGTRSAQLSNMAISNPLRADDAFVIPGTGPKRQTVQALVPLSDLLIFTESGEWMLAGDDKVVSFKSYPEVVSNYGSEKVKPIVIGPRILMVQQLGQIVRDIAFSFQGQGYSDGEDRSIFVQHLFKGRKITCWASQKEKGVIWVGCDDGAFFTFTYILVHDIWGWSMQETAGRIEAIKAVQETGETGVYFAVRRFLNGEWRRTIERLRTRDFTTIKDAFFVDCGISYDNPLEVDEVAVSVDGIDIEVTAHGLAGGAQIDVQLPGLASAETGAAFDQVCFVSVLDADTIRLLDADGDPLSADGWLLYEGGGNVREMVSELVGFDHIANMPVSILADGAVVPDVVVSSTGGVSLPFKAGRVHGGIPYVAEWQTLELKKGQQTSEGVIKSVEHVTMRVAQSRGFEIGPTFDKLGLPPPRDDGMDYGPIELQDGDYSLTMDAEWNETGAVCARQSAPLPTTIVAFIPAVVYQGE